MSAAHLVGKGKWGPYSSASRGHCRRARGQAQSPLSEAGEGEGLQPLTQKHQPTRLVLSFWLGGFCRGKGAGTVGSSGASGVQVTPARRLWALSASGREWFQPQKRGTMQKTWEQIE